MWFMWVAAPAAFAGADDRIVRQDCCGRAALTVVARYLRPDGPPGTWERYLPSDRAPFSVGEVTDAAAAAGLDSVSVHWEQPTRARFDIPCVLLLKSDAPDRPGHFVACLGERGGHVCLADYPARPALIPRERLYQVWTGTAIYVGLPGDPDVRQLRWQLRWPGVAKVGGGLLTLGGGYAWWRLRRRVAPRPEALPV